jgi:hypothetical protein
MMFEANWVSLLVIIFPVLIISSDKFNIYSFILLFIALYVCYFKVLTEIKMLDSSHKFFYILLFTIILEDGLIHSKEFSSLYVDPN